MTPKVKAILKSIGYDRALLYNRSLAFRAWEPRLRGDRYFKNKTEARRSIASLDKLQAALLDVPEHILDVINSHSKNSKDWGEGRDPLVDVANAIGAVRENASNEISELWSGPRASPRPAGEDIARHMAEIFVLGNGKLPGSGSRSSDAPSGPFPQAVHAVFKAIGSSENFRRPCIKAVKWLKADDNREFERLMRMRTRRRKSIVTSSMN